MGVKSSEVKIYAPPHFKTTWQKFLDICSRDGQSASELVRIWVEGYVARKDPGNPQRPLTAYTPGHDDHVAMIRNGLLQELRKTARGYGDRLPYSRILDILKRHDYPAKRRRTMADSLAHQLGDLEVQILY